MTVRAVIVAAGYGTRFLPVTRVVPKELLPIVARPALDLVLDELEAAGIDEVLVITSRRKRALDDWFDHDVELEAALDAKGDAARRAIAEPRRLQVQFIRQQHMRGTAHALSLARSFAGDAPLLVAFPDDLFSGAMASAQLVQAWRETGCAVLGAVEMGDADVSAYGVIDGAPRPDGRVQVARVVEKPAPGQAPSSLISVGRYLYTPALLDAVVDVVRAHGDAPGEIVPMPAMARVAANGGLVAQPIAGQRWDTGAPLGYLQCVVDNALADPQLGPQFAAWLAQRTR